MSYSIDRSAGTRGIGAVASRDLREGRGGAVVRTGSGPVRIVSRGGLGDAYTDAIKKYRELEAKKKQQAEQKRKAKFLPGYGMTRAELEKVRARRGAKKPLVRPAPVALWKSPKARQAAAVQAAYLAARGGRARLPLTIPIVTAGGVVAQAIPVPGGALEQISPTTPPPSTSSTSTYGGGGGGGGGFSMPTREPSSEASIQEAEAAAEAREAAEAATSAAPTAEKKPMSTGAKAVVALGLAAAVFYMWKGGDLG